MIGKLTGMLDSYGEDFIIVDVGGVGYVVHCSARTLQALPAPGDPVTLAIETHVREDQIRLFGFITPVEREWFRLLQTVQGVGTKVALSVLGTLAPADLASAIALRDKAMIARSPGVGQKVAERIVTELKDKAPAYASVDPAVIRLSGAIEERRAPQPVADAISALVNLGYGQPQAAAAIAAAKSNKEHGRAHRTRRQPQLPPSPSRTRVFPSSAIDDWSKSETSDLDEGEGWGGGYLFDCAGLLPPSRLARRAREPTSPSRGEVTGASCQPFAIALPHRGGGVQSTWHP